VLARRPPGLPSPGGTVRADKVAYRAVSDHPLRFAWQTMRSPFARVADYLRRKKAGPPWQWWLPADSRPLGRLNVIALISGDTDRRELTGICSRKGWNLLFVGTLEEARTVLEKVRAPVVLCDRDLPGCGWRATMEGLASSPHRACIILVSAVVDSYLWNEVVRTGGFDVLSKPFREDDVARAVRLAWSYWNTAAKPSGDQEISSSDGESSGEEKNGWLGDRELG